ncbi:MAG: Spy/CpxP family protein refolding chaperone [Phycisphaeraceae bacterium]|nr:Spy/CpxP family protein refolding chaperone [Phycisphaeraceae bacterium]
MKTQMNQLGVVGLVLVLLITSLSFGQPPEDDQDDRPEMRKQQRPHHAPLLRGLFHIDLTNDQKEQIETILQSNKEGAEAAHEAIKAAKEALHTAVESEDETAIRSAAADLGHATGEQAVVHISIIKAVKSVLTEEQLTELADLKEKAKKWMKDGKFERGQGPRRGLPRGGNQGPKQTP